MRVLRRFKSDQSGTTAMLFGFAFLPLVGLVGGAVDYSRAAAEQTKLQRAVDAAVLALVREPRTATKKHLEDRAASVFASVYSPSHGVIPEAPTVEKVGDSLHLTRSARMTNAFMQVVGVRETAMKATATATWGMQRIELALVLDNTGSMDNRIGSKRKIDELKRSAIDLVDRLRAISGDRDDVRVSVVPFDTEVRVDPSVYRNKDWLRWEGSGSRAERNAWGGYIIDRYRPKDTTDEAPAMAVSSTLYPTLGKSQWAGTGDLAFVQSLTSLYDGGAYRAVKATINSMKPRGNTNVGLGVSWGLATLTGSIPLETAPSSDPRPVKRYMIVLTDGDNTQKWVDGEVKKPVFPTKWDPTLRMINDSTLAACGTAKGAGVEVFTIRLLAGDADMLRSCASPANALVQQHYFNVEDENGLDLAFGNILKAITGTRLTH